MDDLEVSSTLQMPLSLQVTKQLSADAGGSSVDAGGGSVDTELDEKEISDLPKKFNANYEIV